MKPLLDREGFETLQCADGSAALQGAIENGVALVITDGNMAVMEGFDVLSRLRGLPATSTLPIVMLTSLGSEQDVRGSQM